MGTAVRLRPGPEATYASNAARQAAYRERQKVNAGASRLLLETMIACLDAGGQSRLADNLPDEPNAALLEIARRIDGKRMILARPEDPEVKRARDRKSRQARAALAKTK